MTKQLSKTQHQSSLREMTQGATIHETLDFDALYLRYKGLATRRISEIIRDDSQVEDIYQETALALWLYLPKLRSSPSYASLIYKITTNKAIDAWHKKQVRSIHSSLELLEQEPVYSHFPVEERDALQRACTQLSSRERQVLALHFVEGYSYVEIAGILHQSERTVRNSVARARATLDNTLRAERQ